MAQEGAALPVVARGHASGAQVRAVVFNVTAMYMIQHALNSVPPAAFVAKTLLAGAGVSSYVADQVLHRRQLAPSGAKRTGAPKQIARALGVLLEIALAAGPNLTLAQMAVTLHLNNVRHVLDDRVRARVARGGGARVRVRPRKKRRARDDVMMRAIKSTTNDQRPTTNDQSNDQPTDQSNHQIKKKMN